MEQDVIQIVVHSEPPTYRDESASALQVDIQWADNVEERIQQTLATSS